MSNSTDPINIDYLAYLARLELSDAEKEKFKNQLGNILVHFKALQQINTDGIEALAHPFPSYNVWAEDEIQLGFTPEEALMNAPEKKDNELVVPQVVE